MNNESVALSVSDLRKHFGAVEAVRGLSLNIRVGECFGLLGPNGAGKTTTIELLEGILRPSSGTILYLGEPLGDRFRREAGIQFQHTALQAFLTVRAHLASFARLHPRATPIAALMPRFALGDLPARVPRTPTAPHAHSLRRSL